MFFFLSISFTFSAPAKNSNRFAKNHCIYSLFVLVDDFFYEMKAVNTISENTFCHFLFYSDV